MEINPSFHLKSVVREKNELVDFEGPLSLILLLLQKNKIEIRDIRVSEILEQYLAFLDGMERLDLEVTSDFVQMASYLILIKTKMILSQNEEVSELELLIESLEQLKAKDAFTAVKEVSPALLEAYKVGALIFSKQPEPLPKSGREYQNHHEPVELLAALKSAFMNAEEKPLDSRTLAGAVPKRIIYSVKNKSTHILNRLKLRDISLSELYAECSSKSEIVATFVSVLELCAHGNIVVSASRDGSGYELSFVGGNIEDIIEEIEKVYE